MKKLYENSSDGWSDAIQDALSGVCDSIAELQYEVNNCIRGCDTGCDTAEELAEYIRSLAEELQAAATDVEGCPTSDDLDESVEDSRTKMEESEDSEEYVSFDFTGAPGYMGDGFVTVEQDARVFVTWPNGKKQSFVVNVNEPGIVVEKLSECKKPMKESDEDDDLADSIASAAYEAYCDDLATKLESEFDAEASDLIYPDDEEDLGELSDDIAAWLKTDPEEIGDKEDPDVIADIYRNSDHYNDFFEERFLYWAEANDNKD